MYSTCLQIGSGDTSQSDPMSHNDNSLVLVRFLTEELLSNGMHHVLHPGTNTQATDNGLDEQTDCLSNLICASFPNSSGINQGTLIPILPGDRMCG